MVRDRRVWGTLLALAFAFLALSSGLDRLAPAYPQAAQLTADIAAAGSHRAKAAQALERGDADIALLEALEAVDADPVNPQAVSLLAAARLALGEREDAAKSFSAADRLGLRTPLVQAYFFEAALDHGDAGEAANRLDFLLAAFPRMVEEGYFFSAMEASDSGKVELAEKLRNDPEWSGAYLSAFLAGDEVLKSRARFLAENATELRLGCVRIDLMLRELARRNLRAEAQQLALAQCPERSASQVVADPGFDRVGNNVALGWQRHGSGDVRITSVGRSERKVEIENRSGVTRLVLSQAVALAEGEYRIFASVAGQRGDAVIASLDCGSPRRPSRAAGALGRGQLLRATDCSDQVLGIWLRPGSGTLRVDNLRLEPVGIQRSN